jgi:hypothetical protein
MLYEILEIELKLILLKMLINICSGLTNGQYHVMNIIFSLTNMHIPVTNEIFTFSKLPHSTVSALDCSIKMV